MYLTKKGLVEALIKTIGLQYLFKCNRMKFGLYILLYMHVLHVNNNIHVNNNNKPEGGMV